MQVTYLGGVGEVCATTELHRILHVALCLWVSQKLVNGSPNRNHAHRVWVHLQQPVAQHVNQCKA